MARLLLKAPPYGVRLNPLFPARREEM
jgi:hypothetical protein